MPEDQFKNMEYEILIPKDKNTFHNIDNFTRIKVLNSLSLIENLEKNNVKID